jgi:hypothetical protein
LTRETSAAELRRLLRGEIRGRLESAGWSVLDERAGRPFALFVCLCPIDEQFAATAEVQAAASVPDHPPVSITDVSVGVSYEPLRRLWPLLGTFGAAVVEELPRARDEALYEVAKPADVSSAVDRMARLILDRAVPFANAHASFDGLLRSLRDREGPAGMPVQAPALCVAALLAAAGRFEEARDALDEYRPPSGDHSADREQRRIARQLRRWIDSAGDASLLPGEPPPAPSIRRAIPSLSQLRRHAGLREEAVAEIARTGGGHDRDALRARLQAELARRGVEESPHWIEQTLDHLWDTRADRARLGLHGLKLAGRLGLGIAKAVRDRELPDISPPSWLAPPERAAYTLPSSDRWVGVQLDPGATGWLERAHDATPRLGAMATGLRAWLDWDSKPPTPGSRPAVHLGERRVGVLSGDAGAPYLAAMKDAEFRDELPNTAARLTRRDSPPHWLLELSKPDQPRAGENRG